MVFKIFIVAALLIIVLWMYRLDGMINELYDDHTDFLELLERIRKGNKA